MLRLGAIEVGFSVLYSSVFAILLFLMMCSLRAGGALGWQITRGPHRAGASAKVRRGLAGASFTAVLCAGIAVLGGADPLSVADDWFYVMALPALIGFGIAVPPPRRPSLMFAATAMGLAVCVGWTGILVPGVRHDVRCNSFTKVASTRCFALAGSHGGGGCQRILSGSSLP